MDDSEKRVFSWIHLSDIHFGQKSERAESEQNRILHHLKEDIIKRSHDFAPDVIFVTGDVANRGGAFPREEGKEGEYKLAKNWLEELARNIGLSSSVIYIVPGNHDVDRTRAQENASLDRLLRGLRNGQDSMDSALKNPDDIALLRMQFENYLNFAKSFSPSSQELYWTHSIQASLEFSILLIGVNSAYLCRDDTDKDKLLLGLPQLELLPTDPKQDRRITMLLGHHPFEWLADGTEVIRMAKAGVDLHLCGHLHDQDSVQIRTSTGKQYFSVFAGAAYMSPHNSDIRSHSYNHGTIVLSNQKVFVRIWPRKYSPKNFDFRPDEELVTGNEFFDFCIRDYARAERTCSIQEKPEYVQCWQNDKTEEFEGYLHGDNRDTFVSDEDEDEENWRWLSKENGVYLEEIRAKVKALYAKSIKEFGSLGFYTPHVEEHGMDIEDILHRLIPKKEQFKWLTQKERFYLLASAWLHDLGMLRSVAQRLCGGIPVQDIPDNEIRKKHHVFSEKYISEYSHEIGVRESDRDLLSKLCFYHKRSENINDCDEKFGNVRLKLLAAYLRLADALLVKPLPAMWGSTYSICLAYNIPPESKLHWMKSTLVSGITPKFDSQEIVVTFKLPYDNQLRENEEKYSRACDRISAITRCIIEDYRREITSVMSVLTRYHKKNLTYYLDVVPLESRVHFDQKRLNDLWELIINHDIMTAPSASRLLEMTLATIAHFMGYSLKKNEAPTVLFSVREDLNTTKNRIQKFLADLQNNLIEARSSHLGLRRLAAQCHLISTQANSAESLVKEIDGVYQYHRNCRGKIRVNSKRFFQKTMSHLFKKDMTNILLYGYSELACKALCGLRDWLLTSVRGYSRRNQKKFYDSLEETQVSNRIRIFVCEGQPKTQTGPDDRLIYHDGSQYCLYLNGHNFNNIVLIPDIIAGHLLQNIPLDLVIIGASGITTDSFRHSAGHASIVGLAREYRNGNRPPTSVVLVVSSEKFSHEKSQIEPQNLSPLSGTSEMEDIDGCWFWRKDEAKVREHIWMPKDKALLDSLYKHKIAFFNPRDDIVPITYVDHIITDCGYKKIEGNQKPSHLIEELFSKHKK